MYRCTRIRRLVIPGVDDLLKRELFWLPFKFFGGLCSYRRVGADLAQSVIGPGHTTLTMVSTLTVSYMTLMMLVTS